MAASLPMTCTHTIVMASHCVGFTFPVCRPSVRASVRPCGVVVWCVLMMMNAVSQPVSQSVNQHGTLPLHTHPPTHRA